MGSYMSMLAAFILGGLWRRWLGGWGGNFPRGVKMAVGVIALAALLHLSGAPYWMTAILTVAVFINYSLGHGSYMDLGTMAIPDNEYLRRVLDLFWREPPYTFKRDFLGLSINYNLSPALAVVLTGFWPALLAGPAVAVAYTVALRKIGRRYYGSFLDGFTAAGELAAGAILWLAVVAAVWSM